MGDAEFVEESGAVMTVGERLREAREASGLSLEDIATQTRIPTRHLESLEAGDFSRLPAPTYSIGFAKNFAGAVGLDRAEIGDQLRAEMGGTRPVYTNTDLFEPADPARDRLLDHDPVALSHPPPAGSLGPDLRHPPDDLVAKY